jgi:hypothetical protein
VYNRFRNWAKRGVWEQIFHAVQLEPDEIASILDATIVRAHQDAAGGKGGSKRTLSVDLVEVSPRRFILSWTPRDGRFTSN